MSFLRQKPNSAAQIPLYTGLQIQTSSNAVPIQIMWGANKMAPNIIWTGDFTYTAQRSTSGGGKGGGAGPTQSYDYKTGVALGLCEGPVAGVSRVWSGQSAQWMGSLGLGLYYGSAAQAPWTYLSARHPDQALAYRGLAYAVNASLELGSSPSLPALSFEIEGQLLGSGLINPFDANPALIIQDFLTNPQYGVGFPAASIDAASLLGGSGGSSYQVYCNATTLAMSPVLANQEAANSILGRWLHLTNTAPVWSGGLLKFIPYGDAVAIQSGQTFVPNVTPIYDLSDDHFVGGDGEDPVRITRSDPANAKNWLPMECLDRNNSYDATTVNAFDQAAIESFGLQIDASVSGHEFCDPYIARNSAQLILQRSLYIRNVYSFTLSFEHCLLEPMDLVTLTDPGLGLDRTPVRIITIEEDDDGNLAVTAEEFPTGVASATEYPVQGGASTAIDRGVAPGPVNTPIIFEPPSALAGGARQIWAAVSGGAAGVAGLYWGGAYVYASTDNATYRQIGSAQGPARQGGLTAALASHAGANPDTVNMLAVSLAESGGELTSASERDAASGVTLCLVEGELLAYATATLTGVNAYALTYLERGLYNSASRAHPAGAVFARLDQSIFKYDLPAALVGVPLYFKFQSFNIFGNAPEDLSACAAYAYTPSGASGALGPVAQALAVGTNLDFGLASTNVNQSDDFGLESDPYVTVIDLGLASA